MAMTFEQVTEGTLIRLPLVNQGPPIRGCRDIPAGLFRVVSVRPSVCTRIGKREWDTVAEVVKVSRSGAQIGKYRYAYSVRFFMEHGDVATCPGP